MKKMIAILIAIFLVISITACMPVSEYNSTDITFADYYGDSLNQYYNSYIITDNKTGVNYIIFENRYNNNISIVPRFKKDGTLYTS